MDKEKEFVDVEPEEAITVPDRIVDQVLQVAERRLVNIKRIKEYALSLTNQQDWISIADKPYLCASGAEKIARPFGVKISISGPPEKIKGTDAKGEYYIWIYRGTASLSGFDSMDIQGICSSRDKFFAVENDVLKPISEVDEPNIMKKAYNNLVMNGITRILGLRNLTWEEVKAGADQNKVSSVKFHSKKVETDPKAEEERNGIIANIARIVKEQCGSDEKKIQEFLIANTTVGSLLKAQSINDLKGFPLGRCKAIYVKLCSVYKPAPEQKAEPENQESLGDASKQPPAKETKQSSKTAELRFDKGSKK